MKGNTTARFIRQTFLQVWKAIGEHAAGRALDPFPLRQTLKGYSLDWFKADIRGGTDGALLAVPQGIAFAVIAGLPLSYGVTCSAVAPPRHCASVRRARLMSPARSAAETEEDEEEEEEEEGPAPPLPPGPGREAMLQVALEAKDQVGARNFSGGLSRARAAA